MPRPAPSRPALWRGAVAASLLALALCACATPQPLTQVGLNRETPEATYEYFKAVVRANQHGAEWSVFSPAFKRKISAMAGRNVDVSDYSLARNTMAPNSDPDIQALLQSELVGATRYTGPDTAVIAVASGGRTIHPRLVRLTRWEMRLQGEDEPAGGYLTTGAGDAVTVNPDGSITVRVRPEAGLGEYLRTIPRERIEGFTVKGEWYVDDLPELEQAVGAGPPAPQPPAGRPPAPGPPARPEPAPDAVRGGGSPDG